MRFPILQLAQSTAADSERPLIRWAGCPSLLGRTMECALGTPSTKDCDCSIEYEETPSCDPSEGSSRRMNGFRSLASKAR